MSADNEKPRIFAPIDMLDQSLAKSTLGRLTAERDAALAACAEMRAALEADASGLATALGACREEVRRRSWLLEGRGPYEWSDEKYKDEAGSAMRKVVSIAEAALRESGARVTKAHTSDAGRGWVSPEVSKRLTEERDAALVRLDEAREKNGKLREALNLALNSEADHWPAYTCGMKLSDGTDVCDDKGCAALRRARELAKEAL